MLTLTTEARKRLSDYFRDKPVVPIRISYRERDGGPPSFGIALDEPKATDEVFEIDGCYYLIDKELAAAAQSITIDLTPAGFKAHAKTRNSNSHGGKQH